MLHLCMLANCLFLSDNITLKLVPPPLGDGFYTGRQW